MAVVWEPNLNKDCTVTPLSAEVSEVAEKSSSLDQFCPGMSESSSSTPLCHILEELHTGFVSKPTRDKRYDFVRLQSFVPN